MKRLVHENHEEKVEEVGKLLFMPEAQKKGDAKNKVITTD
jgi:hypothetical protein